MHKKTSRRAEWLRKMASNLEKDRPRRAFSLGTVLQACLYLMGFGAICNAAFTVSSGLGWSAIGISCFVFEWLSRSDNEASTNRNGA